LFFHQVPVPLTHLLVKGLFFCVGQIIVGIIDGFEQFAIVVMPDEFLGCQCKQLNRSPPSKFAFL